MPTLLDLCGIPIPDTVEGRSLVSGQQRNHLYGEHFENELATRMMRDERYKLIWYPVGNRFQLFDLQEDPNEMNDLIQDETLVEVQERLRRLLLESCYGSDLRWIEDDQLVGEPDREFQVPPLPGLLGQRGWR